jgi:hypothetical protein
MSTESRFDDSGKDLVVVGSSAGGVGALSTLVSTLPKNFPAPDRAHTRFIHTIVPIMDLTTAEVNRLFIYSEKVR